MNNKLTSDDLIKRIKPHLSDEPIIGATLNMKHAERATISVEFAVTDELLKAIAPEDDAGIGENSREAAKIIKEINDRISYWENERKAKIEMAWFNPWR